MPVLLKMWPPRQLAANLHTDLYISGFTSALGLLALLRPLPPRCLCSLKTVVVTLWGSTAEGPGKELEEQAEMAPVVAISSCRVSSYNGVSGDALRLLLHLRPVWLASIDASFCADII